MNIEVIILASVTVGLFVGVYFGKHHSQVAGELSKKMSNLELSLYADLEKSKITLLNRILDLEKIISVGIIKQEDKFIDLPGDVKKEGKYVTYSFEKKAEDLVEPPKVADSVPPYTILH